MFSTYWYRKVNLLECLFNKIMVGHSFASLHNTNQTGTGQHPPYLQKDLFFLPIKISYPVNAAHRSAFAALFFFWLRLFLL